MDQIEDNEKTRLLKSSLAHTYTGSSDEVSSEGSSEDELEKNQEDNEEFQFFHELKSLTVIALPTVGIQASVMLLYPLTASFIGRNYTSEDFGAYSLASMTGNLTLVSLMIGMMSANETLQPRSFGLKQYREVGLLAVRGFIICLVLMLPFTFAFVIFGDEIFFWLLGEEPQQEAQDNNLGASNEEIANLAGSWMKVYLASVISQALYRSIFRISACQQVDALLPVLYGSFLTSVIFHPIALQLTGSMFGFLGTAVAISLSFTVCCLVSLLLIRVMKVHEVQIWPCWPIQEWSTVPTFLQDAMQWDDILKFMKLGLGGVLALTYWWFWESMTLIAAKIGMTSLCAHTVAYQMIPILFMIPLGISIGLSNRIGKILPVCINKAKQLVFYTMIFTICIGGIISIFFYKYRVFLISIFTKDESVAALCESFWSDAAIVVVLLFAFGCSAGIHRALGIQWRMAVIIVLVLWVVGQPLMVHRCLYNGGGVVAMYRILKWLFAIMDVLLILSFTSVSWQDISDSINANKGKL